MAGSMEPPELEEFNKQAAVLKRLLSEKKDTQQLTGLPWSWTKKATSVLDTLVQLLEQDERRSPMRKHSGQTAPCLQTFLNGGLLAHLCESCLANKPSGARKVALKFFESLLTNLRQPLLIHQAVLLPLDDVLHAGDIRDAPLDSDEQLIFTNILYHVAVRFVGDLDLLTLFFGANYRTRTKSTDRERSQPAPEPARDSFPVFTALLPFMHTSGPAGDKARDSILLCMELSRTRPEVAKFMLHDSSFCQALATGLSALYSELPSTLTGIAGVSWRMSGAEVANLPQLQHFLCALEFCNSVVRVAHPMVAKRIIKLIYDGFLELVIGPLLHQKSQDALVAVTCYVDLCIRTITEVALMRPFLEFLITHSESSHPGLLAPQRTLDVLIDRIDSKGDLCLATLKLFRTLLDLDCEDIVFALCLDYLLPGLHIKGGYAALRSAAKKPPGDVVAMTPKRCLAFLQLRPSPVESPGGSTFNNYIIDAKRNIRKCAEACSCWTSPYDGSSVADAGAAAVSNGAGGLTTNFHDATASSSSPASVISSPAAADSRRQSFGGAGAGGRAGGLFANLKSKIMTARAAPSPSAPSPSAPVQHRKDHFFRVLFRKLEKMLSLPLQTNLMLTDLIVRLCCYPHPLLRDYLLDPFLPLEPSAQPNLYSVLAGLANDVCEKKRKVENFDQQLQEIRNSIGPSAASSGGPKLTITMHGKGILSTAGAPTMSTGDWDDSAGRAAAAAASEDRDSPRLFRRLINNFPIGKRASAASQAPSPVEDAAGPAAQSDTLASFSRRTSTSSISSELDDKAAELGTASAAAAAATGRAGKTGKPKSKRRLVLSVLVFEEFLEELAALSLEHSVR